MNLEKILNKLKENYSKDKETTSIEQSEKDAERQTFEIKTNSGTHLFKDSKCHYYSDNQHVNKYIQCLMDSILKQDLGVKTEQLKVNKALAEAEKNISESTLSEEQRIIIKYLEQCLEDKNYNYFQHIITVFKLLVAANPHELTDEENKTIDYISTYANQGGFADVGTTALQQDLYDEEIQKKLVGKNINTVLTFERKGKEINIQEAASMCFSYQDLALGHAVHITADAQGEVSIKDEDGSEPEIIDTIAQSRLYSTITISNSPSWEPTNLEIHGKSALIVKHFLSLDSISQDYIHQLEEELKDKEDVNELSKSQICYAKLILDLNKLHLEMNSFFREQPIFLFEHDNPGFLKKCYMPTLDDGEQIQFKKNLKEFQDKKNKLMIGVKKAQNSIQSDLKNSQIKFLNKGKDEEYKTILQSIKKPLAKISQLIDIGLIDEKELNPPPRTTSPVKSYFPTFFKK